MEQDTNRQELITDLRTDSTHLPVTAEYRIGCTISKSSQPVLYERLTQILNEEGIRGLETLGDEVLESKRENICLTLNYIIRLREARPVKVVFEGETVTFEQKLIFG